MRVETSPRVSESTKEAPRGITLWRFTFSENFQQRRTRSAFSDETTQPEASSPSASKFAPLRDRFFAGIAAAASDAGERFRARAGRLWQMRRRLAAGEAGGAGGIAQPNDGHGAISRKARHHVVAERVVAPQVLDQEPPGGIRQSMNDDDCVRGSFHLEPRLRRLAKRDEKKRNGRARQRATEGT